MVPVLAVFVNILIIPMVGMLVFLGIFLLILSFLSDFIASGIGEMINWTYQLIQYIVSSMAGYQITSFDISIPPLLIILLGLFCIYLIFNINKTYAKKLTLTLVLASSLVYLLTKSFKEKNLEVSFLDVGQGDAAFIRFPNGNTMLIDAGNSSAYWDNGVKTILPFLKKRGKLHINYLVGSHGHNDHIGGIYSLISRIRVDTLVLSGYKYNTMNYNNLINLCNDKNLPVKYVKRGEQLYPDLACRVYILHPNQPFCQAKSRAGTECNNSSIVIKIQYGENGILFTGDLEKSGEMPVLEYGDFLESEILKVAHHGSNTSTSPELLQYIRPLIAIVSVAEENKFDHPAPLTIENLRLARAKVFTTARHGAILFTINPNEIRRIQWRNVH
jgi:competence protein ComEC